MKYTGFLCGAFSTRQSVVADADWRAVTMTEAERSKACNYYYPEFVEFSEGCSAHSMRRYEKRIDQRIPISVGYAHTAREVEVNVAHITLYQAPYGMALFAIRIDMESEGNDITAVVSRLRSVDGLFQQNAAFASAVLDPLMAIYRRYAQRSGEVAGLPDSSEYYRLVEYGNKFKVFQIAISEEDEWVAASSDKLLFELGTLSPIGSYNPDDEYSSSDSYFNKIIGEGKVSVFNNWKALSLFDTFSILGHRISATYVENWVENYFGMLFVNELFVKFYLFRLNNEFRNSQKGAEELLDQFNDFEYKCWFDNVSYNFLPRLIHRSMEQGLEVLSEKQRLYQMIERQKENRQKRNDQRMNNLLFYLTLLTTLSTIWDASSLCNEMYPYEHYVGSSIGGFRLVGYSMMLVVLLLVLTMRFRRK